MKSRFSDIIAFAKDLGSVSADFSRNRIRIGRPDEINGVDRARFFELLKNFRPIRKGPWDFFGTEIDANWRSDWKFDRFLAACPEIEGRSFADIGCNNGYYMLRCYSKGASHVVGFDPVEEFQAFFDMVQSLCPCGNVEFRLDGYDALLQQKEEYDIISCMGIIYHHRDPVGILQGLRGCLRPGGVLVLETMGVLPSEHYAFIADSSSFYGQGDDRFDMAVYEQARTELRALDHESPKHAYALFSDKKYANTGGVWFLPTPACVFHWLRRSGYKDIQLESVCTFRKEQIRTEWGSLPGISEYLDPAGGATLDGRPEPVRIMFTAR